ncbi:MAG: glycosyltransferase family 4 protein [Coriobacteriia bacterium]|nr:glycosyltransferase family 4 protein [Coriobacteriia bacterium]
MTDADRPIRQSVFFAVNDYWACGWYRCQVPGAALERLGYSVIVGHQITAHEIEVSDVVVTQQPSRSPQLSAIRAANAAGKLSVVELDDDVWNLVASNPGYEYWSRPDVRRFAHQCVEEAQLVTTPTHYLADKLRKINPNVRVLPNMLPPTGWDFPKPKAQREDKVTLGWAGSVSHAGDFRVVDSVIHQILDRYEHVDMVVAGGPELIDIHQHPRLRHIGATDIESYPTLLEQFDIGLIPLADTTFNRGKSDLKFVEYSMLGIPSIAAKLEPYEKTVKHGENGFLASSAKDWLKHLTRLVEDVELRRAIGAAAQAYARTRTIDSAIDRWERAYGLTRIAHEDSEQA